MYNVVHEVLGYTAIVFLGQVQLIVVVLPGQKLLNRAVARPTSSKLVPENCAVLLRATELLFDLAKVSVLVKLLDFVVGNDVNLVNCAVLQELLDDFPRQPDH